MATAASHLFSRQGEGSLRPLSPWRYEKGQGRSPALALFYLKF